MKKIAQFLRQIIRSQPTLIVDPKQLQKTTGPRLVIGGPRFYSLKRPD